MLDNFKKIYNNELLSDDYLGLELILLNSPQVRHFVYKICEKCITFEQATSNRVVNNQLNGEKCETVEKM